MQPPWLLIYSFNVEREGLMKHLRLPAVAVALQIAWGIPTSVVAQTDNGDEPVQVHPKPAQKEGFTPPPANHEPKAKKMPSKKATPIEIPGKRKPQQIKKKPSKEATPIEIPKPAPAR
jgi:hypothetical protein